MSDVKIPRISVPRGNLTASGSAGRLPRSKQLRDTLFNFTQFVAQIGAEQQQLDDKTKASVALEQAKREYVDFVGELQKSDDYTNYTTMLDAWQVEANSKYMGQLESRTAQKLFEEKFSQFYTEAYGKVAELGISRNVNDAVAMTNLLKQTAIQEATPEALDNLAKYMLGEELSDGERVGGIIGLAMDEPTAKTIMKEAIQGAYYTNAQKEAFQIASQETFSVALDTLNQMNEDGSYANWPELSLADRLQIGEALEDEYTDRTVIGNRQEEVRQETAYRQATQLFFSFDEQGNRQLTRRMMNAPGGFKNRLDERQYVQIMQWFEAEEAALQEAERNQWDLETALEVIQLLGANAPKEEVSAFITEKWINNEGKGTVEGLTTLLNLNRQDDSRPHHIQDAYDALEAGLGDVPASIHSETRALVSRWIANEWLAPDGKTFLPQPWEQSPQDLMKFVDMLVNTAGEKIIKQAYQDQVFIFTPGDEPEDQKRWMTPYKEYSWEVGTRDRQALTAVEKNFAAMQSGAYLFYSEENKLHLRRLANYRTYVAVDQLTHRDQLKEIKDAGIIPSSWKLRHVDFDTAKDVYQSPVTLNPIIQLHNKSTGESMHISIVWNDDLGEEIWTRYSPEAEQEWIEAQGLTEFLQMDPVTQGVVGMKPFPRYQSSRDSYWKSVTTLLEDEE